MAEYHINIKGDIHGFRCGECRNQFDKPVFGKRGDGLILNGCPECGCSNYTEENKVE